MVDTLQKESLEDDFGRKRKSYYESNYGSITFQNSLRRERREQINHWIEQDVDIRRVLDVGCGPAILYPDAYTNCDTYYALDIVESNLEEISEQNERVKTIQADLDSLKWEFDSPTLIISAGSIEYSQDGMANVRRLSRMLAQDGSLIISFPNVLSPYRIWFEFGYRQLVRTIAPSDTRPAHTRMLFRFGAVSKLLRSEGLEIVAVRRLGYCFIPPPFDNWFPKLAFRFRTWFERYLPILGPCSSEFVVFARKSN